MMIEHDHYSRGLRLLKGYAELALASQVLGLAAALLIAPALVGFFAELSRNGWAAAPPRFSGSLALLVVAGALALVGAALNLVAVYARLIPAGDSLARWRAVFSSPAKLMKYGYWAALGLGILTVVVAAASIAPILGELLRFAEPLRGPPGSTSSLSQEAGMQLVFGLLSALLVAILAAIAAFVGWIGQVMLLFELSSQTGVQGFRTAAILVILSMLTGFASVIPYVGLVLALLPAALVIAALVIIRESSLRALLPPPPGAAPGGTSTTAP